MILMQLCKTLLQLITPTIILDFIYWILTNAPITNKLQTNILGNIILEKNQLLKKHCKDVNCKYQEDIKKKACTKNVNTKIIKH